MSKVKIYHGVEGPSHDPYSYTEIEVERFGHVVCLHSGLADWLEIDGIRYAPPEMSFEQMYERFKELTGYPPCDWEKFHNRARAKKFGEDYDFMMGNYI